MLIRLSAFALVVLTIVSLGTASAQSPPALTPPVDAPVERGFDLPKGQFGPGNRGLEYGVRFGQGVRAAAEGSVTFAGPVAGRRAVTIAHDGDMRTTYTGLSEIFVRVGQHVSRGQWLGEADERFHFGVLLQDVYVDPADYLQQLSTGDAIHLVAIEHPLRRKSGTRNALGFTANVNCRGRGDLPDSWTKPPNDNPIVVIGGINQGWSERDYPRVFDLPILLGYSPRKVVRFSYSTTDGSGYQRSDTLGDIREHAARLRHTLRNVARRFPGQDVDVIAHSMGGLVARQYLIRESSGPQFRLPRVDHLLTIATPHLGAQLAGEVADVDANTVLGATILDWLSTGDAPMVVELLGWMPLTPLSDAARAIEHAMRQGSRFIPDPRSVALSQLAPGSELLEAMAAEDLIYGTQVLALQGKFDPIVTADRARLEGEENHVIDTGVLGGHESMLDDRETRAIAHNFLRDAPEVCLDRVDRAGWDAGETIADLEDRLDSVWRAGELATFGPGSTLTKRFAGHSVPAARVAREVWRVEGLPGLERWLREEIGVFVNAPDRVARLLQRVFAYRSEVEG